MLAQCRGNIPLHKSWGKSSAHLEYQFGQDFSFKTDPAKVAKDETDIFETEKCCISLRSDMRVCSIG